MAGSGAVCDEGQLGIELPVIIVYIINILCEGRNMRFLERSASPGADGFSTGGSGAPATGKIKVLVIEAESLFRSLIKMRLEGGDFEVLEASSRAEAMDWLNAALPRVIVLGMKIADAGSVALLRQLREHPAGKDIPVIACVERLSHPALEESLEAGAADFLARPHLDRLLLSRIYGVLGAAARAESPPPSIFGAGVAPAGGGYDTLLKREEHRPSPMEAGATVPSRSDVADARSRVARILVVEDTPIMRRILIRALSREPGFEIVEADTGAAALSTMEAGAPDLVLLDINLPDIGGLELLQKIKENRSFASIPVIMCTARRDRTTIERASALGAVGYIGKPVEMRVMLEKVKSALGMA